MGMFCKHKWILLSETVTKSQFESSMDASVSAGVSNITLPGQMCDAVRKHIQVFSCEKCGDFKRFVENI